MLGIAYSDIEVQTLFGLSWIKKLGNSIGFINFNASPVGFPMYLLVIPSVLLTLKHPQLVFLCTKIHIEIYTHIHKNAHFFFLLLVTNSLGNINTQAKSDKLKVT